MGMASAFIHPSWVRRLGGAVLVAFLVYLYLPVWTPSLFEGDDAQVAVAAEQIARQGRKVEWAYQYIPFRGTYWGIGVVSALFSVSAFHAYYALSAIVAFFLAAFWVAHWSGVAYWVGIVSLLLFPEVITFSYFANPSAPAFLLLSIAGLGSLSSRRWIRIGGGCLLALAITCRIDALAYFPVFFFLLALRKKDWGEGALFCCVTLVLFVAIHPPGLSSVWAANVGMDFDSWQLSALVFFTFFPVAVVGLMGLGVAALAKQRKFAVLVPCALALGLSFFSYGLTLTSPRYLIYTVPFAATLVLFGVRELWETQNKMALGICSALLLLQVFWPFSPVEIWTHDGPRLVAPLLSNPGYQWDRKRHFAKSAEQVSREMTQVHAHRERDVFTFNHLEFHTIVSWAAENTSLASLRYRSPQENPRTVEFINASFDGERVPFAVRFSYPRRGQKIDLASLGRQSHSQIVYLFVDRNRCTRLVLPSGKCPCESVLPGDHVFLEWDRVSGTCHLPPRYFR